MKEFVKSITSPYEKELIEISTPGAFLSGDRHCRLHPQHPECLGRPADGRDLRNQHGRCHKR